MKIVASIDHQLGDKSLKRGEPYDLSDADAKHLLRSGLAREDVPKKSPKRATAQVPAPVSTKTTRKADK